MNTGLQQPNLDYDERRLVNVRRELNLVQMKKLNTFVYLTLCFPYLEAWRLIPKRFELS